MLLRIKLNIVTNSSSSGYLCDGISSSSAEIFSSPTYFIPLIAFDMLFIGFIIWRATLLTAISPAIMPIAAAISIGAMNIDAKSI